MSKQDKLTPEQEKELIMLSAEIEAEAIKMRITKNIHQKKVVV